MASPNIANMMKLAGKEHLIMSDGLIALQSVSAQNIVDSTQQKLERQLCTMASPNIANMMKTCWEGAPNHE